MENKYAVWANRGMWLALVWLLGVVLTAQAQTSQPPVIEWQQVVEANRGPVISPRVAKAGDGGYVVSAGAELVRLSAAGDVNWRSNLREVIGLRDLDGTGYRVTAEDVAPAQGGGFVTLITTGLDDQSGGFTIAQVDANGTRIWSTPVESNQRRNERFFGVSVIPTADGGFFTVGTHTKTLFYQFVTLNKFDGSGNRHWGKEVSFPYPAEASDGPGYTEPSRGISLSDGNFLLVGKTQRPRESVSDARGWAAKVDGQGNVIWQKRYGERASLDDVTVNPYFNGSFIASGVNNLNSNATNTLNIGPDGDSGGGYIQSSRVVGSQSGITAGPAKNGAPAFHTMLDAVSQNGRDFQLTNLALSDQFVWTKTLGGSGIDIPQSVTITDDGGYIVVGTTTSTDGDVQGKSGNSVATWIVKLKNVAPANALTLSQPAYNCQTGAITFNTSRGDGLPITYNAPGISRSSLTSTTGTVEQGLRNDPKPITITATQSGYSTSFTFDFGAFCNRPSRPLPPVVTRLIPDQTLTVGTEITMDNPVRVDQYFMDPTQAGSAHYRPFLRFRANGLPPGLLSYDRSRELLPFGFFAGTPTTTGVYTVTVTATSENISPPDNSVSTTFKITVVDPPVVNPPTSPTGGTLALTQPTYACQTGDITFNSSGGDGTPITYNAPGVSRPSLTSRFGIVEPGLRNDPKPITITATQSGYTTSYTFDFGAYCTQYPLPVLIKPIPDVTLTIGQGLQIEVSQYFSRDPQSNFTFTATALPPGLQSFTIPALSEFYISGISTTATGVFTVTATVANSQIPPPNNSVSTTFKITVVDNPVVGGALTLLPPVYDCATGAITFRSTGGNGSPVEYRAMGITDWTTNPNQFVDTESRTANDVQPFMFTARQNGVTTIYFWNLKAACGRARQGERPN